jgi:ubiquinone/menaquinone biosynthesis C-methylase UbiE
MNPHPSDQAALSVAAYYDREAETWDLTHGVARQNPRFARQLRDNLRMLLSAAHRDAIALELGAGTGPYVGTAAPLCARLVATDLSDGMLAVFSRRLAELGLSNVTLLRQDACDLRDIAAESFDVVYSIGLLETIPDFERLFAESWRVLRPGGFVAGITSNGDCPWYSLRRKLEGGERHGRTGMLATARNLDRALRHAGFASPEVTYWGAAPPGLHAPLLTGILGAAEAVIGSMPLARYLGVLSFRAPKLVSVPRSPTPGKGH